MVCVLSSLIYWRAIIRNFQDFRVLKFHVLISLCFFIYQLSNFIKIPDVNLKLLFVFGRISFSQHFSLLDFGSLMKNSIWISKIFSMMSSGIVLIIQIFKKLVLSLLRRGFQREKMKHTLSYVFGTTSHVFVNGILHSLKIHMTKLFPKEITIFLYYWMYEFFKLYFKFSVMQKSSILFSSLWLISWPANQVYEFVEHFQLKILNLTLK